MSGSQSGAPSKSTLLMQLQGLIRKAYGQLKQFTDGKTQFIGYVLELREQIQHCLVDIEDRGEPAQGELQELVAMDLNISAELKAWYDKGVYNDFQVKEGDPADFLRAQAEYDRTMPPKIQRMIEILERVRARMLGISAEPAQAVPGTESEHGSGLEPQCSKRDRVLYRLIGANNLKSKTNAELWRRFRFECRNTPAIASLGLEYQPFRCAIDRIRKAYRAPAPRRKKSAQESR